MKANFSVWYRLYGKWRVYLTQDDVEAAQAYKNTYKMNGCTGSRLVVGARECLLWGDLFASGDFWTGAKPWRD